MKQTPERLVSICHSFANSSASRRLRSVMCVLFAFIIWLKFVEPITAQSYYGGDYDGYDSISGKLILGSGSLIVLNTGVTNVTDKDAWLTGMLLDSETSNANVYVYWGGSDGDTNSDDWMHEIDLGVCDEDQILMTQITNLNSGGTYFYRFYATNSAGYESWADYTESFLTYSPPVFAEGSNATEIGYSTATLNGNLISGLTANVVLYWGSDANNWANTNNLGTLSPGAISTKVSDLNAGCLYYYKYYGTNVCGEDSKTVAFATKESIFKGGSRDGCVSKESLLVVGSRGLIIFIR